MSGILDKKSRVLDATLTSEGRRQMAAGTFEVSYVTFTDLGVSYQVDSEEGHVDPTDRIYLEACNLPQDQITFEANDEGNLVPFRKQLPLNTPGGSIPYSVADGHVDGGRMFVYSYNYGRRISSKIFNGQTLNIAGTLVDIAGSEDKKVSSPANNRSGFVYSDNFGVIGSILLTSSIGRDKYGKVRISGSSPNLAWIGTKDPFDSYEFAIAVSESISRLKTIGGPAVECYVKNDSVYLDNDQSYVSAKLYQTGTLNFTLTLEKARNGGRLLVDEVQGPVFASQIRGLLTSSIDNFVELQTIGSINRVMYDEEFQFSKNEMKFDMKPLEKMFMGTPPLVNSIDSLFNDDKLSHLENFMYLPPIVKTSDAVLPDKTNVANLTPYLLGNYPSWGDNEKKLTFPKLNEYIKSFNNEQSPIVFTKSSLPNNVVGQFFEVTSKGVSKLDVVDFGPIMNDSKEPTAVTDHVFFVGKVFVDDRGTTCFVNMFTLIFSKVPEDSGDSLI